MIPKYRKLLVVEISMSHDPRRCKSVFAGAFFKYVLSVLEERV